MQECSVDSLRNKQEGDVAGPYSVADYASYVTSQGAGFQELRVSDKGILLAKMPVR